MIRVRKKVFYNVLQYIQPHLTNKTANIRTAIEPERAIAVFNMSNKNCNYSAVALQLGLETGTVLVFVRQNARLICTELKSEIAFPSTMRSAMDIAEGFRDIAALLYCFGAVDETHIE